MKHYEITEWVDFVRGLTEQAKQGEMSRHLAGDCKRCSAKVTFLVQLVAAARADERCEVPGSALQIARTLYQLQRPVRVEECPRLLAKLVFDSFREPAVAGVRGQQWSARQAMYEAGDYWLDLRMEQDAKASIVEMVGQIMNRAHPDQKMKDVSILLMTGNEVLGRTRSNEFGEFQLAYEPRQPFSLYLTVEGAGREIEVRLQDRSEGESMG